jgi:hypothetical protein
VILSLGRHGRKQCADFVAFQVVYGARWSALDGYGQEALSLFHLLGIRVARKRAKEWTAASRALRVATLLFLFASR